MSRAASKDALETLHGTLATKLSAAIEEMDGESKGLAALLNVARQFLKDNNIDAAPTIGSPLGALADKVAEFPFNPADDSRH